ncbi:MAG: NUDIX hydrolase [Thermoanaerobaculales bacterium]|nr:NUDIX hydrolase [Thermoanaerobaculales bacterium]
MGRDDRLLEKKIDGKLIYEGRILDLEVDRVSLPNGGEATREVVRHKGAVVVLPLHEDRRIELVRQHRYPTGEVLLELPAGKLDPGEEPVDCAGRELAEETAWRPVEIHELGSFFTTPGFTDEVLHAFIATPLEAAPEVAQDPDEAIEIVTMNVEEALDGCRDGTIRDSKTIATLFLARLEGWI